MKTLRSVLLRPVLAMVACASITACTSTPPRQTTDIDYRSRSSSTAQGPDNAPGSSRPRLTIQSGEGERLNLPWFVRQAQDQVNRN
ncbi:hypothetical protein [Bordetella ansorpii]|uniref:hypothetical protein n=1 Tax=Bordetella ansorpii TaxID=288768 RepID=UPI0009EE8B0A|nr:hypothetical protein [Bordetella ansorpii]